MAEHIRNQVDISGFVIKIGRISAPEFMRTDLWLERSSNGSVFFDKILNGALCDPLFLQAEKKRVFISGQRFNGIPFLQVISKSFGNFGREVENNLISAFSCYNKGVVFKINIVDVQADAFADADPSAQEQGKEGIIAF